MHRTDKYSQRRWIIWPVWLNGWVFIYELSGSGFESRWSHLNFRFRGCFQQGVPWHSGNCAVWIHSEMRAWHDNNIQSLASLLRKTWEAIIWSILLIKSWCVYLCLTLSFRCFKMFSSSVTNRRNNWVKLSFSSCPWKPIPWRDKYCKHLMTFSKYFCFALLICVVFLSIILPTSSHCRATKKYAAAMWWQVVSWGSAKHLGAFSEFENPCDI